MRDPRSATPRIIRKIAPSSAKAMASFGHVTSRCSGSGGSSSSTRPHAKSKTFFESRPAMSPPRMLNGMNRSLPISGSPGLALARDPRLHRNRLLLGHAARELAPTLDLGVHLRAEQNGDIGDPQPDEEDDDPGEAPVGLVIRGEIGYVEGKAGRGRDPEQHREDAARRDPAEARVPDV